MDRQTAQRTRPKTDPLTLRQHHEDYTAFIEMGNCVNIQCCDDTDICELHSECCRPKPELPPRDCTTDCVAFIRKVIG